MLEPMKWFKAETVDISCNTASLASSLAAPGATSAGMTRYNEGKPRYSLIPASFWEALLSPRAPDHKARMKVLEGVAQVLTFGAKKYGDHNWRKAGSWSSVMDSAMRHCVAILNGETVDAESGLPHWAHLGCNLAFLIEFSTYDLGLDDRFRHQVDVGDTVIPTCLNPIGDVIFSLTNWSEFGQDNNHLADCLDLLVEHVNENL